MVQSYNTMLTLSHLSSVSDGIVLVENSTLNSTCQKVLKIARPSIHVSSVPVRAFVCGAPLGSALHGLYDAGLHSKSRACSNSPQPCAGAHGSQPSLQTHAWFDWVALQICGAIAVCSLAQVGCTALQDINRVAAQSLAATLLPSRLRPAAGALFGENTASQHQSFSFRRCQPVCPFHADSLHYHTARQDMLQSDKSGLWCLQAAAGCKARA